LRNTVAALERVEPLELPADFDLSFNRRLDEAISRKEAARIRLAPVLVKAIASIVLALAIGLASSRYFTLVSPAVIAAQGKVQIYDRQAMAWTDAGPSLELKKGDIIRTAKAAKLKIEVPGFYLMMLKENSEIEVSSLMRRGIGGTAAFRLKRGRALIDIKKKLRLSRFKVRTPAAETKALGTKFVVDVTKKNKKDKTWVGVLDGEVEVTSTYLHPEYAGVDKTVVVKAGEKTEVISGLAPVFPERLLQRDWQIIQDLYQLGQIPQVSLLISTGKNRTRELLRPCPIYIQDKEPRTIPQELEEAVALVNEAVKAKDEQKHLEAIRKLEQIVTHYPDRRYNAQFLLFIGAYYNYIDYYEDAINSFQEVVDKYSNSTLASLAQAAIAIIYEEGLHDYKKAREAYNKVLYYYPDSPEVFIAEQALEAKKVR